MNMFQTIMMVIYGLCLVCLAMEAIVNTIQAVKLYKVELKAQKEKLIKQKDKIIEKLIALLERSIDGR